jgi:hypothetical protein
MKGKVIYQDKARRVTKVILKSEAPAQDTTGVYATKYSLCDNTRCRRDGIYHIEGIVYGWTLHTCRKHMKTMTAADVKGGKIAVENMAMWSGTLNKMWDKVMAKR